MTAPTTTDPAPPVPLNPAEWAAVALVAVLGLVGMVNSFARVADAARPSFGAFAVSVPIGIDIGILAFAALDLVLARRGMRAVWLRAVPWALTAVTVYLNVSDEVTGVGWIGHAALPLLWVAAVETGAHAIRTHYGMRHQAARMDRVRWSRWVLSPVTTARLWRRMVLWEVTDYPTALKRERARQLARCDLVKDHGRLWRWKADPKRLVRYRMGELTPEGVDLDGRPAPAPTVPPARAQIAPPAPAGLALAPAPGPARVASNDELVTVARDIARDLGVAPGDLGRGRLVKGLRDRGYSIGTTRAGALAAELKRGAA